MITFIIAVTALVIAFLCWLDIAPPDPLRQFLLPPSEETTGGQGQTGGTLGMDDALSRLRARLEGAREGIDDPEKKAKTLERLAEASKLMSEWAAEARPRMKETYEDISAKTSAAMESVRSGAKDAREKVEGGIENLNQIEEEKENDEE